jgi:hypothetical protein
VEFRDWAIIIATAMGPVLAVQAQKSVEALRERRNRKNWVFTTLMGTRQARTSADHVRALNMIDLAFDGHRILGLYRHRTTSEQSVLEAWHEYLNHLNTRYDEATLTIWGVRGDDLFTEMLVRIARDLSFKFDKVQLKTGSYWPRAHADIDTEQQTIRKQLVKLLSGDGAVKIDVARLPSTEAATQAMQTLIKELTAAASGERTIRVEVSGNRDTAA